MKRSTPVTIALVLLAGMGPAVGPAIAEAPLSMAFTYQGRLQDGGVPFNGDANLVFQLYDARIGGNLLGVQTPPPVTVTDGLFIVTLNEFGEFGPNAFNGGRRWMQVEVNGVALAARQEVTATPYALHAKKAGGLVLPYTDSVNAGGAFQPAFEVRNTAGGGQNYAVVGKTDSTAGTAVFGRATANSPLEINFGVRGESDSSRGIGVYGVARRGSVGDITYGVLGQVRPDSGQSCGVFGWNTTQQGLPLATPPSGDGAGVYGLSPAIGVKGVAEASTGATYGGHFVSASSGGRAVLGAATALSGDAEGVKGQSASSSGTGVLGLATSTTGTTYGVYGQSNSSTGYGVYGTATRATGVNFGGFFHSPSDNARALYGHASAATGSTYGVVGHAASPTGYGVYSIGNFAATGTKTFQIDHPLDPANKYLNHYCTEGPEPLNVYSGNVITDEEGEAWVVLPDYFEEINRDFRYSLTVIDESDRPEFVQAKVMRKVQDNRFAIMTSHPHVEISWRVEGIRNDLWVRTNGAPSEQYKPQEARGKYLHPELYGERESASILYDVEEAAREVQLEAESASPIEPAE